MAGAAGGVARTGAGDHQVRNNRTIQATEALSFYVRA
jgi:hypothetical protein